MKLLIQRVTRAHVEVEGKTVGSIGAGLLVLMGITHTDTQNQIKWLSEKLIHLRIFEDEEGKTNTSLMDRKGALLVISQFTLYAECNEGRRPSFTRAAPPHLAKPLYEQFIQELKQTGLVVESGIFGAEMQVSLVNDGPFTLLIEK